MLKLFYVNGVRLRNSLYLFLSSCITHSLLVNCRSVRNLFLLLGILNLSAINLIANSTRIHLQLAEANHWRSGSKFNDGIRYLPFRENEMILRKENRSGKSFNYKSLFYTEKNAGNSATFYILFRHIYFLTLFKSVCLFYLCQLLFS